MNYEIGETVSEIVFPAIPLGMQHIAALAAFQLGKITPSQVTINLRDFTWKVGKSLGCEILETLGDVVVAKYRLESTINADWINAFHEQAKNLILALENDLSLDKAEELYFTTEVYSTLFDTYKKLGLYTEALETIETAFPKLQTIHSSVPEEKTSMEKVSHWKNFQLAQLAIQVAKMGRLDEAQKIIDLIDADRRDLWKVHIDESLLDFLPLGNNDIDIAIQFFKYVHIVFPEIEYDDFFSPERAIDLLHRKASRICMSQGDYVNAEMHRLMIQDHETRERVLVEQLTQVDDKDIAAQIIEKIISSFGKSFEDLLHNEKTLNEDNPNKYNKYAAHVTRTNRLLNSHTVLLRLSVTQENPQLRDKLLFESGTSIGLTKFVEANRYANGLDSWKKLTYILAEAGQNEIVDKITRSLYDIFPPEEHNRIDDLEKIVQNFSRKRDFFDEYAIESMEAWQYHNLVGLSVLIVASEGFKGWKHYVDILEEVHDRVWLDRLGKATDEENAILNKDSSQNLHLFARMAANKGDWKAVEEMLADDRLELSDRLVFNCDIASELDSGRCQFGIDFGFAGIPNF